MASKKKHLKYRATKSPVVSKVGPKEPTQVDVPSVRATTVSSSSMKADAKSKEKPSIKAPVDPHTLLTIEQQAIVRGELWHILWIALAILALYGILWYGFHYLGWSEVILRYIPHGQ